MKMIFKLVIDISMIVILVLLMAFNILGQEAHEWLGIWMFIIFVIHNILNFKWYKNIMRGKYNTYRMLKTIINTLIFISMICSMVSGMIMSKYVFELISIQGNMLFARNLHMASAYWGFVLISIHLGMHWNIMVNILKKTGIVLKFDLFNRSFIGIFITIFVIYGVYAFIKYDILSYMFIKNTFVFFDYTQSASRVLLDYLAMMGFFVYIGNSGVKLWNRK